MLVVRDSAGEHKPLSVVLGGFCWNMLWRRLQRVERHALPEKNEVAFVAAIALPALPHSCRFTPSSCLPCPRRCRCRWRHHNHRTHPRRRQGQGAPAWHRLPRKGSSLRPGGDSFCNRRRPVQGGRRSAHATGDGSLRADRGRGGNPRQGILQELLLQEGLAWVYPQYCKDCKAWEAMQAKARKHGKGLWADEGPVVPWDWRRQK